MPDVITSNMGLTIPTINETNDDNIAGDAGYSTEINTDLQIIADHNHDGTTNGGVLITTAALAIDNDLNINGFDLTGANALQMLNLTSDPSLSSDLTEFYAKNGDAWYKNGAGAPVQITSGSGLNVSVGAANIFIPHYGNANYSILNTDTYTYFGQDTTSAATSIFLPGANTVSTTRYYYIADIKNNSETHNITLTPSGSDTINGVNANLILAKNGGTWIIVGDGTSAWTVNPLMTVDMSNGSFNSPNANIAVNAFGNIWAAEVTNADFALNGADGYAQIDANQLTVNAPTTINNSLSVTGAIGTTSTTAHYTLGTRSITRVINSLVRYPTAGTWTVTTPFTYVAGTALATIAIPITNLPNGASLTAISLYVKGGSGHGGLPVAMPTFVMAQYNQFYAASLITATAAIDTSASVLAYEANHIINVSGITGVVIDNTIYTYVIGFTAEGATNFQTGLQVFGGSITYNVNSIDEG